MADEKDDPSAAAAKPPPRRRRRPTPTIDLKATEVSVAPAQASAAASGDASEPSPDAADRPRQRKNAAAAEREPPGARPAAERAPPHEPPAAAPGEAPRHAAGWPLAGAGAAGGLVVAVFFAVLWLAGAFSQGGSGDAALNERLSRVEARLGEVASRPAPAAPDTRALDALTARLAKLEETVAAVAARAPASQPVDDGRLAAIEEAIKSVQGNAADLARSADDNAAATREARGRADAALIAADGVRAAVERNNVQSLANRVAELEGAIDALIDELVKRTASAGDRALRWAIAAQALQAAVERGDAFAAQLAAAKPLVSDPQKLKPLEAFAASGLPSAAALARQLSELAPAMRPLAEPPVSGGFLDRLKASAERLVRIRPVDEAPGDDPAAVVGRIEAKAARSDIAGALAEFAKLPANVRAPAEDWIKQAQARAAALTASRQLASEALAALGAPSP